MEFEKNNWENISPKESKIEEPCKSNKKEFIKGLTLVDLYKYADNASRYGKDLEDIKNVAEEIASKLYEIGVTKLPPESKLSEAYISASKIIAIYQDIQQAQSAMKRIASLISESDDFQIASEKRDKNQK